MFLPSRAYLVETVSKQCICGVHNYYDGLADHLFHSQSGSLWHHALLNLKSDSILDAGVTACGFTLLMHKMYINTGLPNDFPSRSTMMKAC